MVTISTSDGMLELPAGFSMDIEDSSPVFNDRGPQSLPATVAPTPENNRLLGYPCLPESADTANLKDCTVADGLYIRSGKLNVVSASRTAGISFNVGFDNSTVYDKISKTKLSELDGLPVISLDDTDPYEYLSDLYHTCPDYSPLAVFPICTSVENDDHSTEDSTAESKNYCVILNEFYNEVEGIKTTHKVTRRVDNKVTEVTVPAYFGITPFVKVWKVLEIVFEALGYSIVSNPFREDTSLARLVIPNNVADACCTGKIIYADILPDVTVSDFLNALWARFGLTFTLDSASGKATLRLIRDVVADRNAKDLSDLIAGFPEITVETPQYIKLSAAFDIDGTQPAYERWEDFIDGRDCIMVSFPDQPDSDNQTGELNYFDPDWDLAYWDFSAEHGYEDPSFGSNNLSLRNSRKEFYRENPDKYSSYNNPRNAGLSFDPETWMWHSVDYYTHKEVVDTSSFFNWDPAAEGCDALELSSTDTWVPMRRVKNFDDDSETGILMPFFGVGSKFRHTYVSQGSDGSAADSCPLAFLFINYSSLNGGSTSGGLSTSTMALTFQFRNGLFDIFWRDFDELLRHANRRFEFPATLSRHELRDIEMLRPVRVGNLRYLPDMVSYSMGGSQAMVNATLSLRPAVTAGDYDIEAEQGVAEFYRGERRWRWHWVSDNIKDCGESNHANAIQIAKEQCPQWQSADSPFAVDGSAPSTLRARFMSAKQVGKKWSTNPDIRKDSPGYSTETTRTYDAELYYYVYGDLIKNGLHIVAENPGALVKVDVKYTVSLKSKLLRC